MIIEKPFYCASESARFSNKRCVLSVERLSEKARRKILVRLLDTLIQPTVGGFVNLETAH